MRIVTFIKGAAVGAAIMYLFDPSRGRTRRARIRDKAVRAWNDTGDLVEAKTRDLGNRAQGVVHDVTQIVAPGLVSRSADPRIPERLQPSRWSPGTRMLVTIGAGLLALYGQRRGGALGNALGAASVAIITNCVATGNVSRGFMPAPSLPSDYPDESEPADSEFGLRSEEHKPRMSST